MVVSLRNVSAAPVADVPIAFTVKSRTGASLYTNAMPGQSPSLVSVALVPAHGTVDWVDDQVQTPADAAVVSARVGEGTVRKGQAPRLSVASVRTIDDPTNGPGAEGEVRNESSVSQNELVVFAVARRASRIVAAGRAVLPHAGAHAVTRFQLFFLGAASGAALQTQAPPPTLE